MGEKEKTGKAQKKSWFQGLQSEFKKIIWTDKNTLAKQTAAVVVITAILTLIVSIYDSAILGGLNLVLK